MWERIGSRRCHVRDGAGTGVSLRAEGDWLSCTCALTGRPALFLRFPSSGTRFLRFRQNRKVRRAWRERCGEEIGRSGETHPEGPIQRPCGSPGTIQTRKPLNASSVAPWEVEAPSLLQVSLLPLRYIPSYFSFLIQLFWKGRKKK